MTRGRCEEINTSYQIYPKTKLISSTYDGIIIAVAHKVFKDMGIKTISNLCKKPCNL